MGVFAVIDTETNWENQVMSIGICAADAADFQPVGAKYFILDPEQAVGGMYSDALRLNSGVPVQICSRHDAMARLIPWLRELGVSSLFAYNASFDRKHLPELKEFDWYDIMRLAAYCQHNPHIPAGWECCSTGRVKRGYGVEPMLRLLSGDYTYRELHHALTDAMDELTLMRLLGHPLDAYIPL